MNKVVGIVQPSFLPWLAFFERMAMSDVFVYLDDVQYSKNSFHNRNAIKNAQGERILLTVPVQVRGHFGETINEIRIASGRDWRRKHWRTIEQYYRAAPYWGHYAVQLHDLYAQDYDRLIDALLPLIDFLKTELGITTPCYRSSDFTVSGVGNAKLIALCHAFEGSHFVVKPGTEHYHPRDVFSAGGIALQVWRSRHVKYAQLHGPFVSGLSALDFILNLGPTDFSAWLDKHASRSANYAVA